MRGFGEYTLTHMDTLSQDTPDAILDASCELVVAPDGMAAFLTLWPARGGRTLTLDEVVAVLAEHKVVSGIDMPGLNEAVSAGQCHELRIAGGQPPTPGAPTRFDSLLDTLREQSRVIDDDAVVDYRTLGNLLLVVPGTPLMRRIAARPGVAGCNVLGQELPAPAIVDLPYAAGLSGVQPDADDPNLLRAAVAGVPMLQPQGMVVNPVVNVPAVDLASGNIDFDGTLQVQGDIKAGMSVRVAGDIVVRGMVEAAQVQAGGNLIVMGGIVGGLAGASRESDRLAKVSCNGSVQSLFINHAVVSAGQNVNVGREISNSEVSAGVGVAVGGNGTQGSIVGGSTRALRSVKAANLGSMAGVPTTIQVGLNPHAESQRQALSKERQRLTDEKAKIEQLIIFFQMNPDRAKDGMAERVAQTHAKLVADLAALQEKEDALADELSLLEGASIEASRRIWDGVTLHIGRRRLELKGDLAAGRAALENDEIVIR